MEWELQQKGFDFCYDKRPYDRLERESAESVRLYLSVDLSYQKRLLRFLENHDEPRAASTFSPAKERNAAMTVSTLPEHECSMRGSSRAARSGCRCFLGRRPKEPVDMKLRDSYANFLAAIDDPVFRGAANGDSANVPVGPIIEASKRSLPDAGAITRHDF